MRQLSGLDYAFLQLERGNNYMHVAGLGIYDPSTAPGGKVRFKDILRFFSARIEHVPHFRRRLVTVPWELDRPWWVEDADLDVEFHVRHIALPQPGDWRQLCIQVARLHSRPLDRSKPLWEAYVIEGLHNVPGVPPGSFALYTKVHHALIDGEAGAELTRALHSLSAEDVEAEDGAVVTVRVADREPSTIEIYSRAIVSNLQKLPELARFSLDAATRVAGLGAGVAQRLAGDPAQLREKLAALMSGDLTSTLPRLPPATRFSGPVTAHRVFEAVGVPVAELREIRRKVGDATINDLFLTIVGGALNRYLGARGELPATSMVAGVPMTVRGAEKTQEGNRVGMTLMPVHSEIADPLERLAAIRADAATAKRVSGALGKDLAMNALEHLPTPLADVVLRNIRLPRLSLIVSNVRGPDATLYMAGRAWWRTRRSASWSTGSGSTARASATRGRYGSARYPAARCCRTRRSSPHACARPSPTWPAEPTFTISAASRSASHCDSSPPWSFAEPQRTRARAGARATVDAGRVRPRPTPGSVTDRVVGAQSHAYTGLHAGGPARCAARALR
jgi:WS/DGAT/MGAT family acyltransferase